VAALDTLASRVDMGALTLVASAPVSPSGPAGAGSPVPPFGPSEADSTATPTSGPSTPAAATLADQSVVASGGPPGAADVDITAQTLVVSMPALTAAKDATEVIAAAPATPAAAAIAPTLAPPSELSPALDATEQLPSAAPAAQPDATECLPASGQSRTDLIDSRGRTVAHAGPVDVSAETQALSSSGVMPTPVRPAPAPPAQTVAGYEILGVLGRGGMGVVYKARQQGLNRVVALKTLLAGAHGGADELARFRIEAEAVARLQHPNIVQVYEVSEREGQPYLAMEFVDGGGLDKKLDGTPQPPRQAAELMVALARAMHYAHQRGILHRDLKPANVLLTTDGTPKITDFGLAKRLEQDKGQTRTGAIMGTPSYMAPEQAEGKTKHLGPAADVYSLGAVLYDLLTGRPPFRGETVLDTLEQVRTVEPVRPSRLQPRLPPDLETICLRCLAKEPGKRYGSAGELADDLDRYLAGEPIKARPTPAWERAWKWARRRPAAAALAAVSALVVLSLAVGGPLWAEREHQLRGQAEANAAEARRQEGIARNNFERAERRFKDARDAVDLMLSRVGQERLVNEPRMERVRADLLQNALAFYERFVAEKSDDPGVRWETARARQRVGDIQEQLGRLDLAESAYRASAAALEELIAEQPQEPEYRKSLAASHNNLAIVLQAVGRPEEAEQAYVNALAIKTQLAHDFPQEPSHRRDLGNSYNNRGIHLGMRNRLPEAEEAYKQALDLFGRLVADFSHNPDYKLELARTHTNLGVLLQAARRPMEAKAAYEKAVAIQSELVARAPDVPEYRKERGRTFSNQGALLQLNGQAAEAEKAYGQAAGVFQKLAEEFPGTPDYRHELAISFNNLGNLLRRDPARARDAENAWQQAHDLLRKLADELPNLPVYRQELARNRNELGIHLIVQGKPQEAQQALLQAASLQEQLVAGFPGEPAYRQQLARTRVNLGIVYSRSNKLDEALRSFEQAVELQEQLSQQYPSLPVYWEELIESHTSLAELRAAGGTAAEAEKSCRRILELQHKQVEAFPRVPDYRRDMAATYHALAGLLLRRGRVAEAGQHLEEAIRSHRAASTAEAEPPAARQTLCSYYLSWADTLVERDDHVRAAGALAEMAPLAPPAWPGYPQAATLLARCVQLAAKDENLAGPERKELVQRYGDRVLSFLRQAVSQGYKDVEHLKKAGEFEILRSREDFQKLLASLEGKAPREAR
jgi:tetratricopeptide (TPR) repeat protein/predicted Ser/Thr protein kinase